MKFVGAWSVHDEIYYETILASAGCDYIGPIFFYQLPVRVKILNLVFFFIQTNYKIYGKSFSLKFCLWQLILHVGIPYLYFKEIRIKIPHVNTLTVGN